ncbi:MAG: AAA family ATPase [Gammaproteobacteria bacterium]|nr:AAA family ATPase [Gammaproteobacteria bacterium]NNJ85177.1 AAA family ATPase [Gammaproteobacteria bacterium]
MKNNALKEIEIRNFKCFEKLRLEGFKRVNLIGGKNNVGKTAFMEAVEIFVSSSEPRKLFYAVNRMIRRRQNNIRTRYTELDFINRYASKVEVLSGKDWLSVEYVEEVHVEEVHQVDLFYEYDQTPSYDQTPLIEDGNSIKFSVNGDEKAIPIRIIVGNWQNMMNRRDSGLSETINFIGPTRSDEQDVAILYGALVDLNKEVFLNESLQLFDENIISLKLRPVRNGIVLKVEMEDFESPVLLSSLGEGVNRYISILCAIWASQNGLLFIDEIENGIHYANYNQLWRLIFKASNDANCQLFITTHSKECIHAFHEANDSDEGVYFEFYKNSKKDRISAHKMDRELLEYVLSHDGRVRGD